jgi:hypothetical protein
MACTSCGAEVNASCTCGVAYVPKSVRAAEAIAANPEKSDRAIAKEIGVGDMTVGRARNQLQHDVAVDERIGLDGKTRSMPTKPAPEPPPVDRVVLAHRAANPVMIIVRQMTQDERLRFRTQLLERIADAMVDQPDTVYF